MSAAAGIPDLGEILRSPLDVRYRVVLAAAIADGAQGITLMYCEGAGGEGINWLVGLGGPQNAVPFTPKDARNIATRFERGLRRKNYTKADEVTQWPKDIREAADEAMDRNRRRVTPKDVMAAH